MARHDLRFLYRLQSTCCLGWSPERGDRERPPRAAPKPVRPATRSVSTAGSGVRRPRTPPQRRATAAAATLARCRLRLLLSPPPDGDAERRFGGTLKAEGGMRVSRGEIGSQPTAVPSKPERFKLSARAVGRRGRPRPGTSLGPGSGALGVVCPDLAAPPRRRGGDRRTAASVCHLGNRTSSSCCHRLESDNGTWAGAGSIDPTRSKLATIWVERVPQRSLGGERFHVLSM